MLETGIKNSVEITVNEHITAKAMGSGELEVFATPAMVALIEQTAWQSVAPHLENGQGTVGTLIHVEHLAPTPLGMHVRCETTLTAVEGRKLTFTAEVNDECGLIGRATHERFIIDNERFQQKANGKTK